MTRTFMTVSTLILTVLWTSIGDAQETPTELNAPYNVHKGDVAALLLQNFMVLKPNQSGVAPDPRLVTYEPDAGVIDIEIYASFARFGSKIDHARDLINADWEFVSTIFRPYVQRRLGEQLDERHFRIICYDRSDGSTILYRANGQNVIP